MGRLTQMIEYLNAKEYPTKDDIKSKYTHFTPDDNSKKIRRKYLNELKK